MSLQVLNSYLDELAASSHSQAAEVTFWVKTADGSACEKVDAQLPAFGSLGPLFYAFGLISQEDLRNGSGSLTDGKLSGPWWQGPPFEPLTDDVVVAQHHGL